MYKLKLVEISKKAGLSLNYFCNVFKEYTGMSVHSYINMIRVEKAKELLETTNMNFSEIAEVIGFSNIHLFSRVFKRVTGMTRAPFLRSPDTQK